MGGGAGLVQVFAGTAVALLVAAGPLPAEVLPAGLLVPAELALPPAEQAASPPVTHAIMAAAAVTLIDVLIAIRFVSPCTSGRGRRGSGARSRYSWPPHRGPRCTP